MKKQLIIVVSVLITALLLFGVYVIFFQDDTFEESDPFYTLTDEVKAEIEKVEENIDIVFSGTTESKVTLDDSLNRAYKYALQYNEVNSKIDVDFDKDGSYYGIIIKKGSEQKQISFDDFYKSFENGTKFAFDGERLYTNAILSLCEKNEISNIELRALPGYDTDGDTVTSSGLAFLYPNITRNDVLSITVKNQDESYKVYRNVNNDFVFEGAQISDYNQEMLTSLLVNSTFVTSTKVKDPKELSEYGLDSEENATSVITVLTLDDVTHKIIIGKKDPSGFCYYAKYYTKDFVYMIRASDFEVAVLQPLTKYLLPKLVVGISSAEDANAINNVVMDFNDENISIKAMNYAQLYTSSNLKALKDANIVNAFTNKIYFEGTYTSWVETPVLGGFTTTDGKSVYLEVPLANYGKVGDYKVSFGILKDEDNHAFLPKKISAKISVDGDKFTSIDIGDISFSQGNKEIKTYSFNFHSDEHVQYVRVYFETDINKYIVLDELTVYVDGIDAHPGEGIVGGWKLVSPGEYIPEGKNFIFPNYNFTNEFVQKVAVLMGDSVVDYGITSKQGDPDKLIKEKLEKYGLDKPEKHVSFVLKGRKQDIYFSHLNENGKYYCYSVISVEKDGEVEKLCWDIIAEVSLETAPWLSWDHLDFLEQSLVSMMINTIDTITLTFDEKDYIFNLEKNNEGKVSRVTIDGKEVDLKNFRYLYQWVISINLKGEYNEGDGIPSEVFKIKINSKTKSPELIFYRVTTSKAYYTIDGQGSNYVMMDSINTVKDNLKLLLEGKEVHHR